MNYKYRSLIKDTAVFAVGSLGSKIILFFLVPLYTNCLTTAEYGTADLISTLCTLIMPFVSLSVSNAVLRYGMKKDEDCKTVISNAFIILLLSSILTILITPIIGLYKPAYEWKMYLAVQIILSNVSEVQKAYLKVKNRNRLISIIGIVHTAILAGGNIIYLTLLKAGVRGYLLSSIISQAFCIVVYFFAGEMHKDVRLKNRNYELMFDMVRYSSPLVFSGISWWVLHSSDKVMIEWMIGASALGLYTAATKIPSLINVITGVFNQAWGISTIKEYEASNGDEFYVKIFNLYSTFLFVTGSFIIVIAKPFMSIYVGEAFRNSWRYVPFLLFSAIFYSLFAFMGSIYLALKKPTNDMWTSVFCAILNLIINYIGIKAIGTNGAVLGTLISYAVFTAVRIYDVKKYISYNIDKKCLIINSGLVAILTCAITFDIYPMFISILCLLGVVINNRNTIMLISNKVMASLSKMTHR